MSGELVDDTDHYSSDSKYFVEHLGLARFGWPNTGWTKAEGGPVDNVRRWKDLKRLVRLDLPRTSATSRRSVDPREEGRARQDRKKAANSPLKRKIDYQRRLPR